jgi:4-amino-4-deoxy-L-arabinose transferase-like glycosyltransferase
MTFPKIPPIIAIAILTAIVATLTLHRLGAADVCNANEAVEAVFLQQMVEHGVLVFPLENGVTPMYKPPLFHWTSVALDRLARIRKVTPLNLRLPSALYATAGAALTILFACQILGLDAAILAGLALAGSYQYVSQGRFGRVDMTLCFFESLALFAFIWWIPADRDSADSAASDISADADARSRLPALYLMTIAIGLGVLAKGPVGALLPGFSILLFMIVERRWRQMLAIVDPGAIIVGAALASSWYLACYLGGRYAFLDRQLGAENVGRFFGRLGAMTPWYYLKPVLLNSAPLSLLVPIAVAYALRARTPVPSPAPLRERVRVRVPPDAAVRLFAIFWIVTVVFFSLAAYKRRAYLLPLWPASAVLLGWWITTVPRPQLRRLAAWTFAAVCCLLAIFNFFYLPRAEVAGCRDDSFRPAAEEIARVVAPADPLFTYGFHQELAPLLFYLDRDAPVISGRLGDAPPGYIIVPAGTWKQHQHEALDLEPVLTSDHGSIHLILLKRGKSYAAR